MFSRFIEVILNTAPVSCVIAVYGPVVMEYGVFKGILCCCSRRICVECHGEVVLEKIFIHSPLISGIEIRYRIHIAKDRQIVIYSINGGIQSVVTGEDICIDNMISRRQGGIDVPAFTQQAINIRMKLDTVVLQFIIPVIPVIYLEEEGLAICQENLMR